MVYYYGLYIGNSTVSIAAYKDDGKVEILANEAGDRVTPAIITITQKERVVGSAAGSSSYSLSSLTIRNNKTLLDLDISEEALSRAISKSLVKVERSQELTYTVYETDAKPQSVTATQVATLIFSKLHGIAIGASPGQNNVSCVLCVPRHWSELSRRKVAEAASEAGWKVIQVINQPPAALLAYRIGFEKPPIDLIALVYRLGGISCDATVIKLEGGLHTIISYVFNDNIGGKDMVNALCRYLAEEFRRKYHLDPAESRKSMWKLSIAAEAILHTLSTLPSCSRFLESVCEGVDLNVTVSRARLDALIGPLLPAYTQPIHDALVQADLEAVDISKVVLCGGSMNVPRLKDHISSLFKCEVFCNLRPDEVFACGAAQQAGLIASLNHDLPPFEADKELPILAAPITVKVGESKEMIIEKAVLPCSKQTSINIGGTLEIIAEQISVNGQIYKGEVKLELDEKPQEHEVHIKATLQNELHVEVIDNSTKEVRQAILNFRTL